MVWGGGAPIGSVVTAFSVMAGRSVHPMAPARTPLGSPRGPDASSDRKLRPWAWGGAMRPLISSRVGRMSMVSTVRSTTTPGATWPGPQRMRGSMSSSPYTLCPWKVRPCSRNSSPWSPVKTRTVLWSRLRAPRRSTSRRISASMARIDPSYQSRS